MKYIFILLPVWLFFSCSSEKKETNFDFTTTFEASLGTETEAYDDLIEFYTQLAEKFTSVAIYTMPNAKPPNTKCHCQLMANIGLVSLPTKFSKVLVATMPRNTAVIVRQEPIRV